MSFEAERCVTNVNAAQMAVLQQALLFVYDRLTSRGEPVPWRPDHDATRRPSLVHEADAALADAITSRR